LKYSRYIAEGNQPLPQSIKAEGLKAQEITVANDHYEEKHMVKTLLTQMVCIRVYQII
jgi:hypothetical protein